MVDERKYRSQFKNRYGESWQFEYDRTTRQGILCGSDVDWQQYRVVNGRVPELILSGEEIDWLRSAWQQATMGP
jgi:hypothetical protein